MGPCPVTLRLCSMSSFIYWAISSGATIPTSLFHDSCLNIVTQIQSQAARHQPNTVLFKDFVELFPLACSLRY
jgi:hypothetical protein